MRRDLAAALADGFLSGTWTRAGLVDSGAVVLGRRPRWLSPLARQTLELYPRPPSDRPRELAAVIATLPATQSVGGDRPLVHPVASTRMLANRWALPVLEDQADVAQFLALTQSELGWFADPRHLAREASAVPLQHYRVSHRLAPSGAIRVLEAPKLELKRMQRCLLDDVVSRVPPHPAARGFRPGGSVSSYAAPHADRPVVIRLDLEAFFASVTVARVYGIWRTAGYPEPVAHCLAGLMTTVLPRSQWRAIPRPANSALLDGPVEPPPPGDPPRQLSGDQLSARPPGLSELRPATVPVGWKCEFRARSANF